MPDYLTRDQLIDLMLEAADNLRAATKWSPNTISDDAIDYWLAQMDEYRAMISIADRHGGMYFGRVWTNAGSAVVDQREKAT